MQAARRSYNGPYENEYLNQVAFPMGGLGAGMICLEGTGAFSHVSLRHQPNVFHQPMMFAALYAKGARTARLVEGPVPMRKAFGLPNAGNGCSAGKADGLPRFAQATFKTRFPFGIVRLEDKTMPVKVELTGWSPFAPGDTDNASLPVAGLEYRFRNHTNKTIEGVFSFHAQNFMRSNDKAAGTVTLFAFDRGQKLSEHTAPYDAVVQVLDGEARITIDGRAGDVAAGSIIIMPGNVPHAVAATKRFKMLLTMIRTKV